jgi:hypothetical protein
MISTFLYVSFKHILINVTTFIGKTNYMRILFNTDLLCGLVVRVPGYRSGGPGLIPGTTRKKKGIGSGTGSIQPCEYN